MSKSSLSIATMALTLATSGSALLGGTALASAPSTAGANMSQHGIVPSACQTFTLSYDPVAHTFTSTPASDPNSSCTTSSTSSTNTNPGTQNNNCRNYSYMSSSSGPDATGATCNTSATGTRGASY